MLGSKKMIATPPVPTDGWWLNLGCGRNIMPGWVNVDCVQFPDSEIISQEAWEAQPEDQRKWFLHANLDTIKRDTVQLLGTPTPSPDMLAPGPMPNDSVSAIRMIHVLEHLHHPLPLMEELHRVARPGTMLEIHCPHGASDDADEDPTHVRRIFPFSFGYFSQPYYWRASYDYFGDWQPNTLVLLIDRNRWGLEPDINEVQDALVRERNVVIEMQATLQCVKPIRLPDKSLQQPPQVIIHPATRT